MLCPRSAGPRAPSTCTALAQSKSPLSHSAAFADINGSSFSFNIWAFTAASKAYVDKLARRESHPKRHPHHHHQHRHKHNIAATQQTESPGGSRRSSVEPSRSSTLETGASVGKAQLAMTKAATCDQASPDDTPVSTHPSSGAPSTSSSAIDLTKPIITPSAAAAANAEEIDTEDLESECSSWDDEDGTSLVEPGRSEPTGIVTVSGTEPYPPPGEHIVAERVSTHGRIRPFEVVALVPALDPALKEHIGQVHPDGAIQRWLAHRDEWDKKYSTALAKWRKVREDDRKLAEKEGFLTRDLHGERPPLCSLVGWHDALMAREVGKSVDETSKKTSGAVMMWMKMSSKVGPARSLASLEADRKTDFMADNFRPTRSKPAEIPWPRSRRMSKRRLKTRMRPRQKMQMQTKREKELGNCKGAHQQDVDGAARSLREAAGEAPWPDPRPQSRRKRRECRRQVDDGDADCNAPSAGRVECSNSFMYH